MSDMKQIKEMLVTPVREEFDVIVAGGGTGGVVAAIAAARGGARTAIVEQGNVLGGTLLGGGLIWMSFFNNYMAHKVEKVQLVRGIPQELVDDMVREGHSPGHYEEQLKVGHETAGTQVDRELLIKMLLELMEKEGVKLFLGTMVSGVVKEGDCLKGVIVQSKSGRQALLCKNVIDASGDGDVAYMAGEEWSDGTRKHPIGLIFGMGNVDLYAMRDYAEKKGVLSNLGYGEKGSATDKIVRISFEGRKLAEFAPFMEEYGHWGPYIVSTHEREATYINGISTQECFLDGIRGERRFNALDVADLAGAQVFLRKRTIDFSKLLIKYMPGFENAYVNWSAPALGVRSTRVVSCVYDITREDVVKGRIPEDSIGLFGASDAYDFGATIEGGKWFGIPYRAILPKHIDNLFVIGRSITTDWVAHMSTRLVASCMLQGQAAGAAAALCAGNGISPRGLDVKLLRRQLKKDGAFLG